MEAINARPELDFLRRLIVQHLTDSSLFTRSIIMPLENGSITKYWRLGDVFLVLRINSEILRKMCHDTRPGVAGAVLPTALYLFH